MKYKTYTNAILEISSLYKLYLNHCQNNEIKPFPIDCMSVDMLRCVLKLPTQ